MPKAVKALLFIVIAIAAVATSPIWIRALGLLVAVSWLATIAIPALIISIEMAIGPERLLTILLIFMGGMFFIFVIIPLAVFVIPVLIVVGAIALIGGC